jgi:hypothetical protein
MRKLVVLSASLALVGCGLVQNRAEVNCQGVADGISCSVKHVTGSDKISVSWDIEIQCANGTTVTGSAVQSVDPSQTVSRLIPNAELRNLEICDASKSFSVKNIKVVVTEAGFGAVTFVPFFIVIATSFWVYFDAKKLGVRKGQVKGLADLGPAGWFWATLLLWIIAFPLYLITRPKLKGIGAGASLPLPSSPMQRMVVVSSVPRSTSITVSRDGANFGPYSVADLENLISEGRLLPTDQCWYEGLPGWIPLSSLLAPATRIPPAPPASYPPR